MTKKMGRPTTEPKEHQTRIRMSNEDIKILEFCCGKTGLSKSDVIRRGIRRVYNEIKK